MKTAFHKTAFLFQERDERGEDVLTEAALASRGITINGKPFEPDVPIPADDLADRLNNALVLPGHNVRFDYEDGSYLIVTVVEPGLAYIEAHFETRRRENA